MKIYLADLGHNLLTYSSDTYPLGVANIAAYTLEHLNHGSAPEVLVFREPQDLKKALDAGMPDVLGLSNYSWNRELSTHFADYARERSDSVLILMGGPNWPLTPDVQETFLREVANVDAYVDGPTYEGERAFLNGVRRFAETGMSREGFFEESIPGMTWIDPSTDELVRGGEVDRIKDLDEIPSPYLAGLLDPYFETGYFPLLQIARGCPFTCQFCNSSVAGNSRVYAHSIENVMKDLRYVAERVKPEINLCFADDNFGMYPRDEEIADYLASLQDEFGWPKYIRTTTGKNNAERILRVMRKVRGALPMTAAVQSLNPQVLKNIKRDNIKLETYTEVQKELRKQGMQSYGELILCLPGETKASFMQAVEELLETGASRISAHQLMLLHGAPLTTPESREEHGFQTRVRVVARNIGNYTGLPIIETEEMVVETPEFPFEDYIETRVFHLLLTIYFYEGNFEEAFEFAKHHGLSPFDLVVGMQERLEEAPAELRETLDDFVRESKEELFPDRLSCIEWARENYDGLVDGSIGGNLLSKYSMIGRFFATHGALEFLKSSIGVLGTDVDDEQLDAVFDHLDGVLLHAPFARTLANVIEWKSRYDVEAWSRGGYSGPLSEHRCDAPRKLSAAMEPELRKVIQTRIETFGEHPSGLGKFTRTMFAREMRRSLVGGTAD